MKGKVLVIVVSYNGMRWLSRCVDSVRASIHPADLIVIDNASTDGSPEFLSQSGVRLVRNAGNLGFGAANNIGIRVAIEEGYDYVYLLNQDAWIMPDTIGKLVSAASSGKAGILSPVQLNAEGTMDWNFRKKCSPYLRRHVSQGVVNVPFVMAAHWLITRKCLLKTGLFSPAFAHYGEDDNYIDRAQYHGFDCVVVRDAYAVHDRPDAPNPYGKRMDLKCISAVRGVSDPGTPLILSMVWQPVRLIAFAALHRSSRVLHYIPHLVSRYPELASLRRKTRSAGAFL